MSENEDPGGNRPPVGRKSSVSILLLFCGRPTEYGLVEGPLGELFVFGTHKVGTVYQTPV